MGLYSTYGNIQLKVNHDMISYKIGEETDLEDGVYVGREGVVVIIGRKLTATFPTLINKYGNTIDLAEVLDL